MVDVNNDCVFCMMICGLCCLLSWYLVWRYLVPIRGIVWGTVRVSCSGRVRVTVLTRCTIRVRCSVRSRVRVRVRVTPSIRG